MPWTASDIIWFWGTIGLCTAFIVFVFDYIRRKDGK